MAIPESQLEIWSHQGSITQSSNTYNSVKNVLEKATNTYAKKNYSVFLQGSYGNDTNIYSESDVDIVIRLDDVWKESIVDLPMDQQVSYNNAFSAATYTYNNFKTDVLKVLTDSFGNDVSEGRKAIQIKANGNRRKTDVIAAIQYRRYYKFKSQYDQSYEEGICFFHQSWQQINNYPKQHTANLTKKHQSTGKWLKPMARILKNLRGKLIEEKMISAGVAPSYYLEGLLYNVPDDKFGTDYETTFVNAISWIQKDAKKEDLLCANEQYYLLRDGFPTCWKPADCETFLAAAIKLWKDWGS